MGYLLSYCPLKIDLCIFKAKILEQQAFGIRGILIALDKREYPHNIFIFSYFIIKNHMFF